MQKKQPINWNSTKIKHNLLVFFHPWTGPIWLKSDTIFRKTQKVKWLRQINYTINAGKNLPSIFTLSNYRQHSQWQEFIGNFFNDFNNICSKIDLSHEYFSIMKTFKDSGITMFENVSYPSINSMFRSYNQFKNKFIYHTHIDISNYFNSIYLHSITWDLENNKPNPSSIINKFHNEYMKIVGNSETYGLPIGLNISVIISELIGYKITKKISKLLSSKKTEFMIFRYVDDIYILHNKKIKPKEFKVLNNNIFSKYHIHFHTEGNKCSLNNYKDKTRWARSYWGLRKYNKKLDDAFRNNITKWLKNIALWHFSNNDNRLIIDKNEHKSSNLYSSSARWIHDFLSDNSLDPNSKLSCIKTIHLLKFCGIVNVSYEKLDKKYLKYFDRTINNLYKFYIKNLKHLLSEDKNNLGILIYIKYKLSLLNGRKFRLSKKIDQFIKKSLIDDDNLLILVSSLFVVCRDSHFNNIIKNTFYDTEIDWTRVELQSKANTKWLAIDTSNTYNH